MKRRYWIILSTVALLGALYLFSGPILIKIYGIHKPRTEDQQSILESAKKYKLDPSAIVAVEPSCFMAVNKEFKGIPEALIFDREGNYIEYKETQKSCNAGLFGFIPALDRNIHYKANNKTILTDKLNKLRDLQGNPLPKTFLDTTADFYVMISWAVWTGRLNKDHVKVWQDLAAKNTKAKIQVIEVDLDPQQWWPKSQRDSIINSFARK